MENYFVSKFGGSSLADSTQIEKVVEIIRKDPRRKYIVVSAPGKSPNGKGREKLTDILIGLANGNNKYSIKDVEQKFRDTGLDAYGDIHSKNMGELKKAIDDATMPRGRRLDYLKSRGEDFTAKLVAAHLAHKGVKAKYVSPKDLIIVSSHFGNAEVLPESYDRLAKLKGQSEVIVFPGYFGFNKSGEETTFSRGGSDLSGTVVTVGVDASVYENWTDTDGIFSADPRIVNNPQKIREITHREIRELANGGFSVFHEEAMLPAAKKDITIHVRNTNNPDEPGTKIVAKRSENENDRKYTILGVTQKGGFCIINIEKMSMNREVGFGRKVLDIIENYGISYEHTPTSIDTLSVIFDRKQMDAEKLDDLVNEISKATGADNVYVAEKNLALINVVGMDIKSKNGVALRVLEAMKNAGVNTVYTNYGANKDSMIFGVDDGSAKNAVRAIHDEFFGENAGKPGKA